MKFGKYNTRFRGTAALGLGATLGIILGGVASTSQAQLLIANEPVIVGNGAPPLNMLVMGRDHKLYYEAYNDASDLDGNGTLDVGYNPNANFTYYGYFDSGKCYDFTGGNLTGGLDTSSDLFVPAGLTDAGAKTCTSGAGEWSGDFLNYVTTSRIDALRKVLYGGFRRIDQDATGTGPLTVLERSFIPQDAHSWGKEYESVSRDGYDISAYTPYSLPTPGSRHLFANTTRRSDSQQRPRMRVLLDSEYRIWEWVSIERPVADQQCALPGNNRADCVTGHTTGSSARLDYLVRVEVCNPAVGVGTLTQEESLEEDCQAYTDGINTVFKPRGILHNFGETDRMSFGLLSGSNEKSTSGGVLRRAIGSFNDEIDSSTGQILPGFQGIVNFIDALQVVEFGNGSTLPNGNQNFAYRCGWIANRPITDTDQCTMWGNPIGEMVYEALRYFAGKPNVTPAYSVGTVDNNTAYDQIPNLALPAITSYTDPYSDPNVGTCARPFITVISDINPSYDTDQLPGVAGAFGSGIPNDLDPSLNLQALSDTIWTDHFGGSETVFIGEAGGIADSAPTPKTATTFFDIRGLAPEEPTKLGGYYSAALGYFGRTNDINPTKPDDQKSSIFSVALASPLPRIQVPTPSGIVILVPFAKSVAGNFGGSISAAQGAFQPTNQIVDFYVEQIVNEIPNQNPAVNGGRYEARFSINYEDVEQGADHDMDTIVEYRVSLLASGNVEVELNAVYQAGGIRHAVGYVISGTTDDGIYLEVRDPQGGSNPEYFLDTQPGNISANAPYTGLPRFDGNTLTTTATRIHTPASGGSTTEFLPDPLWFMAKYGGFEDENGNDLPDQPEWDFDNNGVPDNYFLVTNALTLEQQLEAAFTRILSLVGSASSAAANSGAVNTDTKVYQALFQTDSWSGEVRAFNIDPSTGAPTTLLWEDTIPAPGSRQVITYSDNTSTVPVDFRGVPFRWTDLDGTQQALLDLDFSGTSDGLGQDRLDYLRGVRTEEIANGGSLSFRDREPSTVLGDVINSDPIFVGAPNAPYPDSWPNFGIPVPENSGSVDDYSTFISNNASREPLVFVGANDGMLHAFYAEGVNGGQEVFAYVPNALYGDLGTPFGKLSALTSPLYNHFFYVDGSPTAADVFFDDSGTPEWRTVIVGGYNAGGRGIYALDITDVSTLASAEANAASIVLWEYDNDPSTGNAGVDPSTNPGGDTNLGFTFSQPAVARLPNSEWTVMFGDGYNGASLPAPPPRLIILDVENGTEIAKLSVDPTVSGLAPLGTLPYHIPGEPNGLTTVSPVDRDGDGVVETVFAGDLQGNLWKFDLSDTDPANWTVDYGGKPLFVTDNDQGERQPITSRPVAGPGANANETYVYFGTGRLLDTTDIDADYNINNATVDPETQSYYGIIDIDDATGLPLGRSNLLEQTIDFEDVETFTEVDPITMATSTFTEQVRVVSDNTLDPVTPERGWYLDLRYDASPVEREMQISDASLRGSAIIFATIIPEDDVCASGGLSWLMALDPVDGSRLDAAFFNLNRDEGFDAEDLAEIDEVALGIDLNGDGLLETDALVIVAGRQSTSSLGDPLVQTNPTEGSLSIIQTLVETPAPENITGKYPFPLGRQLWFQIR